MDRTRGWAVCCRLLDARLVNPGAILTTFMMPNDNDHLEQNDLQVNLYKLIQFNGTTYLVMEPIKVLYYNERTQENQLFDLPYLRTNIKLVPNTEGSFGWYLPIPDMGGVKIG